jgi:hypothetical protein
MKRNIFNELKGLAWLAFLLLIASNTTAQEVVLTKNFLFNDGFYLNFEEFQKNSPTYKWEEVDLVWVTNPQTHLAQIQKAVLKKDKLPLDTKSFWALTYQGIPFIKVPEDEIHKDLPSFAALKLRGKICYFSYPDWRNNKYEIAAYNPRNGRPFRKGTVFREKEIQFEKMLSFETGEIADFTIDNFLKWTNDDPQLQATVRELTALEAQEKLFKCLLIYVDRNQVNIYK